MGIHYGLLIRVTRRLVMSADPTSRRVNRLFPCG
jgi:hypothetical protein